MDWDDSTIWFINVYEKSYEWWRYRSGLSWEVVEGENRWGRGTIQEPMYIRRKTKSTSYETTCYVTK